MKHTLAAPQRIKTDIRPTSRELRWFAHMDRHGPQSSEFLYECTRDSHRCRDTALRRLQALREAGYLRLPPQQRHIAKADFNPYVYDLTKLGWEVLADHQDLERQCRPTGHWWHGFWVSAVTSAIEICAIRSGIRYIPTAHILSIKGVDLSLSVAGAKLMPDQLFALQHTDGYRAYALEFDRGTEPLHSKAARKSIRKSIAQYGTALDQKLHQQHYGLKCNLLVLWVFHSVARERQFQSLAGAKANFRSATSSAQFPKTDELSAVIQHLFKF